MVPTRILDGEQFSIPSLILLVMEEKILSGRSNHLWRNICINYGKYMEELRVTDQAAIFSGEQVSKCSGNFYVESG